MNNNKKTPIIIPANQKGGVGKTLEVGLLGEWFALIKNYRVLIIDLDMQCNSSDQWVGMDLNPDAVGSMLPPQHPEFDPKLGVNERSSIADIFYGLPVLPHNSWLTGEDGKTGYVDVIVGHPKLLEEVNIAFNKKDGQLDEKVHNRVYEFLSNQDVQDSYDIILLDTGPSRSPLFRAAIRSASHIIIPFKPEEKDIQGIASMLQVVRQENYYRPNNRESLQLIGLLPNMVRNTSLHHENLKTLSNIHADILFPKEAWLSNLTAYPERDVKGSRPKSVYELPDNSKAKIQATSMAMHVEKKIRESNEWKL